MQRAAVVTHNDNVRYVHDTRGRWRVCEVLATPATAGRQFVLMCGDGVVVSRHRSLASAKRVARNNFLHDAELVAAARAEQADRAAVARTLTGLKDDELLPFLHETSHIHSGSHGGTATVSSGMATTATAPADDELDVALTLARLPARPRLCVASCHRVATTDVRVRALRRVDQVAVQALLTQHVDVAGLCGQPAMATPLFAFRSWQEGLRRHVPLDETCVRGVCLRQRLPGSTETLSRLVGCVWRFPLFGPHALGRELDLPSQLHALGVPMFVHALDVPMRVPTGAHSVTTATATGSVSGRKRTRTCTAGTDAAGTAGTDAGTAGTDAGSEGTDAGTEGTDAGSEGTDAGTEGTDAGTEGTDAGSEGTEEVQAHTLSPSPTRRTARRVCSFLLVLHPCAQADAVRVGARASQWLLREALQQQMDVAVALVPPHNERALLFAQRLGFVCHGDLRVPSQLCAHKTVRVLSLSLQAGC